VGVYPYSVISHKQKNELQTIIISIFFREKSIMKKINIKDVLNELSIKDFYIFLMAKPEKPKLSNFSECETCILGRFCDLNSKNNTRPYSDKKKLTINFVSLFYI
jgi:hypothetical protein